MGHMQCIDNLDGLYDLAPHWEKLLARSDADPVFLHPVFISCWWRAYKDDPRWQLHILALREGDELAAVAPLLAVRHPGGLKELRLIGAEGQGQADYGGIVYPSGRPEILAELLSYLKDSPDWHLLKLRHISARSSLARDLPAASAAAGLILRRRPLVICTYRNLPDSFAEFMRCLPRNLRSNLRQKELRLMRLGRLEFRVVEKSEDILGLLPVLYDLHIKRWSGRGQRSVFVRGNYREFIELLAVDFAPTGRLHFSGLFLDGRPLALHFGFASAERLYHYRTVFDREYAYYSPGILLMRFLAERAIADGRNCLDFLLGNEAYKLPWANASCLNEEYWLYPDRAGIRLFNGAAFWLLRKAR